MSGKMGAVKGGDFISMDYVGMLEDTHEIFDLTEKQVAKEKGLYDEERDYTPAVVVVGAEHVVKGLDKNLAGMKVGETKDILVEPQDGFGRRDGQLIKLIPLKIFIKRKIRPYPGMRVNLQGAIGRVQSVESGRVLVDFNHPLAGKKLKYTITIKEILEKPEDKIAGLLKLHSGLKGNQFEVIREEIEKYAGIKRPKFVH
jgi:FKBP-type peptidyl-prolyl cis-trans isomerase 2